VSYDVENLHDTALRRCVDLLVALAGLVVLSPVLLVLMLAVRLSSPGPALYRQPRVGRGQREFAIVKLRTMVGERRPTGDGAGTVPARLPAR
jgi:lipopolysaccharide/colanic/teichoic acid biosynthesis glycosyltransferase